MRFPAPLTSRPSLGGCSASVGWSSPRASAAERLPVRVYTTADGLSSSAVNADGVASAAPAVVPFRISPPLWARWWFAAGQTGVADFTTTDMPEGWRSRIRAAVHVESLDGRTRPLAATSVEVFAADTGRSVLFYPGALIGLL